MGKLRHREVKKDTLSQTVNPRGSWHSYVDSDSLGLRWGPRFCISDKLPSEENAVGLRTTVSSSRMWKHVRKAQSPPQNQNNFFGREEDLEFIRVTSTPASHIQHS